LAAEAAAHRLAFRRGLDRSLQVPQLHPNAIAWCGIGYLAYAFEREAVTALAASKQAGIDSLEPSIAELASGLYRAVRRKSILEGQELAKWIAVDVTAPSSGGAALPDRVSEVSWSLIHGDLHLRNIFVRHQRPTLIDFARSEFGPVAIDAAKLVMDALAFVPGAIQQAVGFTLEGVLQSPVAPLLRPFAAILRAQQDHRLFNEALRAYARRYLHYSDVPKDVKDVLRKIVA
jgi:hypothetical protein